MGDLLTNTEFDKLNTILKGGVHPEVHGVKILPKVPDKLEAGKLYRAQPGGTVIVEDRKTGKT